MPYILTTDVINWRGEYFGTAQLTGSPRLVRDDTAVNFNWGTGSPAASLPADNFSVRWTRSLPFAGGNYRFHTAMDDGLRLYVDNTLLINQWRDGSYRQFSTEMYLSTGVHQLRYEEHISAEAHFWYTQLDD